MVAVTKEFTDRTFINTSLTQNEQILEKLCPSLGALKKS